MDKPPYDSVYADHCANWRKAHERTDKKPRKHADLIRDWADGAEIQRFVVPELVKDYHWVDDPCPTWADDEVYRIKPVPKADYTHTEYVRFCVSTQPTLLRVTFDGETGEVKKVEIVK